MSELVKFKNLQLYKMATTTDIMQQLLESVDSMTMSEGVMLEVKNALKQTYDRLNMPALPGLPQVNGDVMRTIQLDIQVKIYYGSGDSPNSRLFNIKKYQIMRGEIPNKITFEIDGVEKIVDLSKFKKIFLTHLTFLTCSSVIISNEGFTEMVSYEQLMKSKYKEDVLQHELQLIHDNLVQTDEEEEFDYCPGDYDLEQYHFSMYNMVNHLMQLNF